MFIELWPATLIICFKGRNYASQVLSLVQHWGKYKLTFSGGLFLVVDCYQDCLQQGVGHDKRPHAPKKAMGLFCLCIQSNNELGPLSLCVNTCVNQTVRVIALLHVYIYCLKYYFTIYSTLYSTLLEDNQLDVLSLVVLGIDCWCEVEWKI